MKRTVEEINAKISKGDVVVMTADEVVELVKKDGVEKAAREVDVVTTGTFGAMCSSGAFLNFGHSEPPIKMQKVWLNDVPAYTGLAAVDAYIGATEVREQGGIRHPAWVSREEGKWRAMLERLEVNPALDDALFAPPAPVGGKPT